MDQLEQDLLSEGIRRGLRRPRNQGHPDEAAFASKFDAEVIQQQVEEAAESEQGGLQRRRVEQAEAEKLQRARAHGPRKHPRQFVIQLAGQLPVEGGELLGGHPGRFRAKEDRSDTRPRQRVRLPRRIERRAVQQVQHEGHRDRAGSDVGRGHGVVLRIAIMADYASVSAQVAIGIGCARS